MYVKHRTPEHEEFREGARLRQRTLFLNSSCSFLVWNLNLSSRDVATNDDQLIAKCQLLATSY